MIEINKENFEEVCQKLNDIEYDETTDKEVCQWFKDKIIGFGKEAEAYEEMNYAFDEISFEYFGAFYSENNIIDIIDVEIRDNKVWINYTTKFIGGEIINRQARLPLDWIFDHDNFVSKWKTEMVKNKIKNITNKINNHMFQIDRLRQELILEKNKITVVS